MSSSMSFEEQLASIAQQVAERFDPEELVEHADQTALHFTVKYPLHAWFLRLPVTVEKPLIEQAGNANIVQLLIYVNDKPEGIAVVELKEDRARLLSILTGRLTRDLHNGLKLLTILRESEPRAFQDRQIRILRVPDEDVVTLWSAWPDGRDEVMIIWAPPGHLLGSFQILSGRKFSKIICQRYMKYKDVVLPLESPKRSQRQVRAGIGNLQKDAA